MFFDQVLMNVPCAIFWKDKNSRFLGCNSVFLKLANLNGLEEIVGKSDDEMPWKNRTPHYQKIDKQVLETGQTIYCNEIVSTTLGDLRVKTTKSPLVVDGKIVGTIGMFQDVSDLLDALEQVKLAVLAKEEAESKAKEKSLDLKCVLSDMTDHRYYLGGKYRGVYLTKREAECLLCLTRGLTAKEMAKQFKISHRTIECYIKDIRTKFKCYSKSALIKEALACSFLEGVMPKIGLLKKKKVQKNNTFNSCEKLPPEIEGLCKGFLSNKTKKKMGNNK